MDHFDCEEERKRTCNISERKKTYTMREKENQQCYTSDVYHIFQWERRKKERKIEKNRRDRKKWVKERNDENLFWKFIFKQKKKKRLHIT